MIKRTIYSILAVSLLSVLFMQTAQAICPLCTIIVGAGIGLAEWLGIDDTITGLWVGGIVVSSIMWTINWMDSKNYRFKGRKILITVAYYLIIIAPLYPMGIMGHPLNKLWGIDKLLLGIILGSIGFFIGGVWYIVIKEKHGGAQFPFQKVVMPIAPLFILSLIFFFITR